MARAQGTNARTQRLTALLATVLLAMATGFAIGRVFVGHASTYRMVLAGVLSAAIAVALERRSLLLATLVSVVAMIAVVGFMVFPDTTWHGLPTLETIRAMLDAAGLVGQQARVQVAPTEPLAPLMLAALTATWASIFSAHALAFRAGSPILALLPPIALVAFADTVLEEVVQPLYGIGFLIAAIAMIFADGLRRVHGWGPMWSGPRREARLGITAGRGARRVALAAVGLAAVSPLLLPGFGSTAVLDFSTPGDDHVRLNPLVSVGASLQRDDPLPVFDVSTKTQSYWRMVALPDFDGTTWNPDRSATTQDVLTGAPLPLNFPVSPSIAPDTASPSFRTTGDLDLPWLPMPYPAVSTNLEADGLRWDPEAGALALADGVADDTTYSITMQLVQPTPDDLRAQPAPDATDLARYLAFPDDLSRKIKDLAEKWTANAGDDVYDQAMAIQERFTSPAEGFRYDDTVEPRDDEDALLEFLTVRAGFCQQFASSMAVMLRTLGIPSRVAVGYTAGRFDNELDVFHVTTDEAHAWVEVFFPSYGWLTFDPTPDRANTIAYPYLDPNASVGCSGGPHCDSPNSGDGQDAGGDSATRKLDQIIMQRKEGGSVDLNLGRSTAPNATDVLEDDAGPSARSLLALGLALVAVVLALVPPFRALGRRRRLRRAAREPRSLILTTYDVFTERAAELGFVRSPGQTVQEFREGVRIDGGLAADTPELADLGSLTTLTTQAAYASRDPDRGDAAEASRAAGTTLKALQRKVGWLTRITGAYRRTWQERGGG